MLGLQQYPDYALDWSTTLMKKEPERHSEGGESRFGKFLSNFGDGIAGNRNLVNSRLCIRTSTNFLLEVNNF